MWARMADADREGVRKGLQPLHFGVNGAIAVAVGVAVILAAPWRKRTMHPVH